MPIYAYADKTGLFRRWYPNLRQLGFGRTSGKGYWGKPGSDVKGNRSGRSYSRYGGEGKGLSDIGTRAFAATLSGDTLKEYVTYTYNGLKAIGSLQVMGHTAATLGYGGEGLNTAPTTHQWSVGAGSGKGTYNIYKDGAIFSGGSVSERKAVIHAAMSGKSYIPSCSASQINRQKKFGGSQFGAMTIGRNPNRKYPIWMAELMQRVNAEEQGKDSKSSVVPMGLALIALKVLL